MRQLPVNKRKSIDGKRNAAAETAIKAVAEYDSEKTMFIINADATESTSTPRQSAAAACSALFIAGVVLFWRIYGIHSFFADYYVYVAVISSAGNFRQQKFAVSKTYGNSAEG